MFLKQRNVEANEKSNILENQTFPARAFVESDSHRLAN